MKYFNYVLGTICGALALVDIYFGFTGKYGFFVLAIFMCVFSICNFYLAKLEKY